MRVIKYILYQVAAGDAEVAIFFHCIALPAATVHVRLMASEKAIA